MSIFNQMQPRTYIQPIEEVPYREAIVPFLQLRGLESIQAMKSNALLASDISYKTWLMASKTFPQMKVPGFAVSQLLGQQALFDILSTGVGYDSSISTSKRISKARSVFQRRVPLKNGTSYTNCAYARL